MHKGWLAGPDTKILTWNNAQNYDMIFTGNVSKEFANLNIPTSLIIGTRDSTGPGRLWKKAGVTYKLEQYQILGDKATEVVPNAQLYEIANCGHLPQFEKFDD